MFHSNPIADKNGRDRAERHEFAFGQAKLTGTTSQPDLTSRHPIGISVQKLKRVFATIAWTR